MKTLSLVMGAFVVLGSATVASAQDVYANAMIQTGQTMVMVNAINAQAKQDTVRLRRKGWLPSVSQAAAGTRFVPDLGRRKAQASKFMAATKRISPDLAESLAPAFQGDAVRYLTPYLAKYGVQMNDVADLTAVYLVSSWRGAHGKTSDPTRAEVVAVRDQIRRTYQGSAKLRGASNATKQNVGEGSLYMAMFNDALIEVMKAHPESKEKLMADIAGGAKAMFGLDLRQMRITKAGLTK
ncbi:MAG: hypothetical protein EOP84_07680 [Verrucomicrobiaceae bacterium]|nr:MAG: hypothetical protein EOP84_07680 [Verrucomicrobiaceae bacterium]